MWRAINQTDSILWPTFVALRPHGPVFIIEVRRIWPFWYTEGKEMTANKAGNPQTTLHLSLQGKGGVGKTLVASILVQYFRERGKTVCPVDTDPVNHSLAQYRELGVEPLEVLRDGRVDQRKFDVLLERLLTESGIFVVDSGASTFIPLWYYML